MNKKVYSAILILLLLVNYSVSQTGTIKIAKPPEKKETPIKQQKTRFAAVSVGTNYTFKGINKVGYNAEVMFSVLNNHASLGLGYCNENQYYQLSPDNSDTLNSLQGFTKSENKADYIKMPFRIMYSLAVSARGRVYFTWGVTPEYLLKTKNQYGRLNYSDFNQFNLSGHIALGFPIRKLNLKVNLGYSKDFFNNLKDSNVYNDQGIATGKQKSKTNLLSLSINYTIKYGKK